MTFVVVSGQICKQMRSEMTVQLVPERYFKASYSPCDLKPIKCSCHYYARQYCSTDRGRSYPPLVYRPKSALHTPGRKHAMRCVFLHFLIRLVSGWGYCWYIIIAQCIEGTARFQRLRAAQAVSPQPILGQELADSRRVQAFQRSVSLVCEYVSA